MGALSDLHDLTDDELVILTQTGGPLGHAAESVLVERHDDLIYAAVSKLPYPPTNPDDADDAYQGGRLGFLKAIRRFRPGDSKLTTYAWTAIYGGALAAIKETRSTVETVSLEDLVEENPEREEFAADDADPAVDGWGAGEVADFVARLKAKQRVLLERRFVHDETQATIAAATGVSESAVSQQLRTIIRAAHAALQTNVA